MQLYKYPRTEHIEGSRLQPGDEDLHAMRFKALRGRWLVVEEKLDGANCAFSFDDGGHPWLQSRGHFLTGGKREAQFALFKQWVSVWKAPLFERLGPKYTVFGEWTFAKHTIFYDALPHYFHEFDVLDRATGAFLSTPQRRSLLAGLPIVSVPVLHEGPVSTLDELTDMVGDALYKSPDWRNRLVDDLDEPERERAHRETDPTDLAEGLYVKHEQEGRVVGRYKWIRASFLQSVEASGSHWFDRPLFANQLAPGVQLFEGAP